MMWKKRDQKKRQAAIKRLPRCKAKVVGEYIGGLVQCKRHMKSGKYCYQHKSMESAE